MIRMKKHEGLSQHGGLQYAALTRAGALRESASTSNNFADANPLIAAALRACGIKNDSQLPIRLEHA